MKGPNPDHPYPFEDLDLRLENKRQMVFLKNIVTRPNIHIGDFTYYDDPIDADLFERKNVLYHYPFSKEKLIIGKFCALATHTKFIMASANHPMDGFSTYPFGAFQRGWEKEQDWSNTPSKGDTVVQNDVWFGYDSTMMPGVHIGNGAIIAAKAVVTKSVPAYAIVGGNPAKIIRYRFDETTIARLEEIAWWDWDIEKISANIRIIISNDLKALERC